MQKLCVKHLIRLYGEPPATGYVRSPAFSPEISELKRSKTWLRYVLQQPVPDQGGALATGMLTAHLPDPLPLDFGTKELGTSHKESSFYLALHSGICRGQLQQHAVSSHSKISLLSLTMTSSARSARDPTSVHSEWHRNLLGTCMILDEMAMPLKRPDLDQAAPTPTHAHPTHTHAHPRPPTPTHAHPRPPTPTHAHPHTHTPHTRIPTPPHTYTCAHATRTPHACHTCTRGAGLL